jgi:hypothetical protein
VIADGLLLPVNCQKERSWEWRIDGCIEHQKEYV